MIWREAWPAAEGARRVRVAFRERYAAEPDGVWAAPGRVNIIGEHVDYNGGPCLPIALPHRTYVALAARDDDVVRLASAQETDDWSGRLAEVAPGTVNGWAGYAVGVPWALAAEGFDVRGFDAVVDSCVPYGAGLSSSAALECAVAVAVDEVFGLGLGADDAGRARLAAACVRAENEIAGAATGGMDQAAALRTVAGHALLLDTLDGSVRHIPFDTDRYVLLVIDTKAPHQLADGQYASRRATTEQAARLLGYDTLRSATLDDLAKLDDPVVRARTRHVVTEIARVLETVDLLQEGRIEDIGAVLAASHASLRDDYEVSCPELDLAVEAALVSGAVGGRMVGGGFGGSAIALVETDHLEAVATGVTQAFDQAGYGEPEFLVAVADRSATKV